MHLPPSTSLYRCVALATSRRRSEAGNGRMCSNGSSAYAASKRSAIDGYKPDRAQELAVSRGIKCRCDVPAFRMTAIRTKFSDPAVKVQPASGARERPTSETADMATPAGIRAGASLALTAVLCSGPSGAMLAVTVRRNHGFGRQRQTQRRAMRARPGDRAEDHCHEGEDDHGDAQFRTSFSA
jgi:hypothetical protein